MANLTVTVSSKAPGAPRRHRAVTGAGGGYRIEGIAPGSYLVSASLDGFRSTVSEQPVELIASGCAVADFGMNVDRRATGAGCDGGSDSGGSPPPDGVSQRRFAKRWQGHNRRCAAGQLLSGHQPSSTFRRWRCPTQAPAIHFPLRLLAPPRPCCATRPCQSSCAPCGWVAAPSRQTGGRRWALPSWCASSRAGSTDGPEQSAGGVLRYSQRMEITAGQAGPELKLVLTGRAR
jgi:hypothetical protein